MLPCMSHVTRHTSHVTRHTSHVTRHTSHVTRHTSQVVVFVCNLRPQQHRVFDAAREEFASNPHFTFRLVTDFTNVY